MDKNDLLLFVNILLGLVAFFGAWVGKNLTEAIKELQKTDKELTQKFEQYVRRDDLHEVLRQLGAIFEKLDKMQGILAEKVSRDECSNIRRDYNGK